ncbi:MAG: ATP-binding protein [Clostridia bacterium]|nr:ATP-binding protein [Clostridia bacterium]
MGYSREIFLSVSKVLEKRRSEALRQADLRRERLHQMDGEIAKTDAALAGTASKLCAVAFGKSENAQKEVERIKEENRALSQKRKELIRALGLPADYTAVKYTCSLCNDTGYTEKGMCSCFQRLLSEEALRASGLGNLALSQGFDNFSLSYYDKEALPYLEKALKEAKDFAESFESTGANLLFVGGTGLGKTHLSTAIARRVVERGFDVVYDIAPNIISEFEEDRFKKQGDESLTDKYFEASLLIIDDLGTEVQNPFSLSTLYRLINTRINNNKSTIISTNLGQKNLTERYEARLTSRLFGHFIPYIFKGVDIRRQRP